MSAPIPICMGGYGPPTTGFSKALKFIGDKLHGQFGDRVAIDYVWNIMDHGHKAEDILTLVENGEIALGYQSSSYLTDRVPELGFVDLPFLFASNAQARASMDGALGTYLARKTEETIGYRILGWFENGFRHISNRLHPVHVPGRSQGHENPRAAERDPAAHLRAAWRHRDAHGPDRSHRHDQGRHARRARKPARQHRHLWRAQIPQVPHAHLSLLYFAPGVPASRFVRRLAGRLKRAMQQAVTEAVAFQRKLAVEEHDQSRKIIEEAGCEIVELTPQGTRRLRRRRAAAASRRAHDVRRGDVQDGGEGLAFMSRPGLARRWSDHETGGRDRC